MAEEGEKLFAKPVNILLKDQGERISTLNISIYNRHTSVHGGRDLYIRLTNQQQLLFLQTLTLSEDDFQVLKQQQGLRVDYNAFPQNFIDLLELCIKDQDTPSPRFILQMTTGGLMKSHSMLEVVETNSFKHLVHLALKFIPGGDEEIKQYLATCLKLIKDEKEDIVVKLQRTESELSKQLSNARKSLQEKIDECNILNGDWQEKFTTTQQHYQVELRREKDNIAQLRHTYENRLQEESRTSGDRYNQVVSDLETKLNASQASNKVLTDHKFKHESLIRDLKSQLATLEEERQIKSKNIDKLHLQNRHLDTDRYERDKTLNHLRTRVAVLEQELKDKEHVNKKTNQLLENTNEQKKRLDCELEKSTNQLSQLENSLTSVSSEVMKGNEIIKKLQIEMKGLKQRIKMMNIVIAKQEKVIEEKDAVITQANKDKLENETVIKQHEEKITHLNANFEETSRKLQEAQETLKNNENVINWLNKQLNENTMSRLSNSHISSTRNSGGGANGRIPLAGKTMNTENILSSNHYVEPKGNNVLNKPPRIMTQRKSSFDNQMPYSGTTFAKPRFQNDNISPILSQATNNNILRQKQTPTIHEESDQIIDAKYLMRNRNDNIGSSETPKMKINNNIIGDENVDPLLTTNTEMTECTTQKCKPYVLTSSSYFPMK